MTAPCSRLLLPVGVLLAIRKTNQAVTLAVLVTSFAMLLAIYRAKIRKNTIILAYLFTCFLESSLFLPFCVGLTDPYVITQHVKTPPPSIQKLCYAGGIVISYFSVLLAGLAVSFAAQVSLYLMEMSRIISSNSTYNSHSKGPHDDRSQLEPWSPPQIPIEVRDESRICYPQSKSESAKFQQPCRSLSPGAFTRTRLAILVLPFVTALPGAAVALWNDLQPHWLETHLHEHVCICPVVKIRTWMIIFQICHLVPASFLNLGCLVLYLRVRKDVSWAASIKPHIPLLMRLGALSLLTATPAVLDCLIRGLTAGAPLVACLSQSLYSGVCRLFGALIFIDAAMANEFWNWLKLPSELITRVIGKRKRPTPCVFGLPITYLVSPRMRTLGLGLNPLASHTTLGTGSSNVPCDSL